MRLVCGMCDFSQLMPMTGDIEGSGHCASDLASTITTLRNLNDFCILEDNRAIGTKYATDSNDFMF